MFRTLRGKTNQTLKKLKKWTKKIIVDTKSCKYAAHSRSIRSHVKIENRKKKKTGNSDLANVYYQLSDATLLRRHSNK
jgi:hypothetical protein